jgi:hypothetical protein
MRIAVRIDDVALSEIVRLVLGKGGYLATDGDAPVAIQTRATGLEVVREAGPERRFTLAHPVWEHELLAAIAAIAS